MVAHPHFQEVTARLWQRGVIPDFRAPDGIRIGLSPLSTRFVEVATGIAAIAEELRSASPPGPTTEANDGPLATTGSADG
jgi:kynureninase